MASTIKVDNVQNQPGTNIINKCSTTITIGASSDTVALASGASQTGFGRTGTVDWQTSDIKTGTFTAADGKGYFINTTSGGVTVNLPAGAAGTIVSFSDYARTWDTNAVTVDPNGSEKIGGGAAGDTATLETEGQSVTFIYQDSTQGWINIQDSTSAVIGESFIVATGGSPCAGEITGNYKYHTFTGPGTFCVSALSTTAPLNLVDYLVIAGGGGGGYNSASPTDRGRAGAGGAGGYRESSGTATGCFTVSPRGACVAAIPVSVQGYPIAVGGGDPDGTPPGVGSNSTFDSITSNGGGRGGVGGNSPDFRPGTAGASGGGSGTYAGAGTAGAGNTPPTNPAQGSAGGTGVEGAPAYGGGGGGGATAVGVDGSTAKGGNGGTGGTSLINGTLTERAGGGGGATQDAGPTKGCGTGGGGDGAALACAPSAGGSGGCNTGGGGGGSGGPNYGGVGGNGGSGVVILRYKFQ